MRFGSPFRYTAAKYLQAIFLGGFGRRRRRVVTPHRITKMEFMDAKGVGAEYRASLHTQSSEVIPTIVDRQIHIYDPERPPAVKLNGGLRGSTATRWR